MSAGAPDRIRLGMIRKQNIIYVAVIAVGLFLIVTSQMIDQRLLTEGIAFIMIGFVGMLMSFTTMDIGASIKEAIREVGRQNAESSANIKEIALGIKNAVSDVGRQNAESSANIMESIREVGRQNAESDASARKVMLDSLAQSNRGFDETLKEIAKSQGVMVALLKNMNEPREAPGEMPDGGKV